MVTIENLTVKVEDAVDPGDLEYHWIDKTLISGISTPFYGIKTWQANYGDWMRGMGYRIWGRLAERLALGSR
jgi:hypothetical protein